MYVLYSRPTRITGRSLRRRLSCHGGMLRHYERQRESIRVVRWGNSEGEDGAMVLNPGNAVANAANKLRSLELMKEAGVNVPRFSTNPADFGDEATILGRRTYHFGGRDIDMLDGFHSRAVYSDYFTEYVPSVREMRLHIFRGECIGAQNKRYEGEGEEADIPVRNHANGYVFVPLLDTRPNQSRIDMAVAAVEAHGLHFGAVDMLVLGDGGSCVLEVNTAPGLSGRYLDVYSEAIARWANADDAV